MDAVLTRESELRMKYAKIRIRDYLRRNRHKHRPKELGRKVNWEIVKLSHRVYNGHTGLRGHLIRQKIRRSLWASVGGKSKVFGPGAGSRQYEYTKRSAAHISRPSEYNNSRLRLNISYTFLSAWMTIFLIGLYLVPAQNLYLIIGESFFNAIVLLAVVYGIVGITHRSAGRKILAVILILLIFGLAYQNQAVVTNLNANSIRAVFQTETSYISAFVTWVASLSLPSSL